MQPVDQVQLAFSPTSLAVLNAVLGLVLFGVALDLRWADLRAVAQSPRGPLVGLAAQFLLLPAAAFGLAVSVSWGPSVELGLVLVAACPGGNISNFLTHLARGNTAMSVGMTLVSTALAMVATPVNLAVWGSLNPETAPLLRTVELDPLEMLGTVAVLLGIPLIAGMGLARMAPTVAARLRSPFKWLSLVFFAVFLVAAFGANYEHFLRHIGTVFVPVLLLNALALGLGWTVAWGAGLPSPDRRAIAIEVGIQNSGLGLILVFDFFHGLGGMAVVAAWWGIWHVVSGLTLAGFWATLPRSP
jgi:BASS family bile acid:Na+ symporter